MIIIDSQVHVWAAETTEKPWSRAGGSKPHLPEPLAHDEVLREMDAAGVGRAILVPPIWEADRNDTSLEAARSHPDRFAVMGRLRFDDAASRERVATWKDEPGMLGFRVTFHREPALSWLEDGTGDWFWQAAELHDVSVMVYAPQAIARLGEVAARHPGLRLIIDHMGLASGMKGEELRPAVATLIGCARLPNVAVKASALPCYANDAYPFPSLHEHIYRVVEAFGPERVFWGTDLSRLPCPYGQAVRLFTEGLHELSMTDKEWIMGRAVAQWLDWSLPEG